VKAYAAVRAEGTARGSALTQLRSEPPLVLRPTHDGLYIVGGAGGPLGGDELTLDIDVRAGADLVVRSAAATLAQPSPTGTPSMLRATLRVGAGARLVWCPEPLVSVRGSHHVIDTQVELDADAELVLVEEVVLGRSGEDSGRVSTRLRMRRDGVPLVAHDLDVGGGAPEWDSPAVLGGARAMRTELRVAPGLCAPTAVVMDREGAPAARAVVVPVAGGGAWLAVALGATLAAARDARSRADHAAATRP